jgi:uncharacterized small protein (DUF1192 family)
MSEPITDLETAVRVLGALPMPVGSEPLSDERLAEIRSLDLLSMMSDRAAPVVSRALADLIAEVERLRAQRDRRRPRLVALQNDALNIRGALSPNGEARKVPMPLGETLLPAVEWLINRVAELERRIAAEECRCPEPAPLCQGCRCKCHAEQVTKSADKLTRMLAPTPVLDGEHYQHVHHDYRTPHDLPSVGGVS